MPLLNLSAAARTVTTDAHGSFSLGEVALERTTLFLDGPRILGHELELGGRADASALELDEPLLCELQVDVARDPALGCVTDALYIVLPDAGRQMANCHFITGERAGFVRTNDCDGTQCFYGRKLASDRIALHHSLHPDRQCDCHDCR